MIRFLALNDLAFLESEFGVNPILPVWTENMGLNFAEGSGLVCVGFVFVNNRPLLPKFVPKKCGFSYTFVSNAFHITINNCMFNFYSFSLKFNENGLFL